MIDKLAIGTVQFGLDYGINNKTGKVSKEEVFQILYFALKNKIDTLDTAYSYGNSEEVLGSFSNINSFKTVSKFTSIKEVENQLKESLKRLNTSSIYGYISHSFNDIKENLDYWNKVLELKEKGLIQKVGFSLYNPEELEFLFEKEIKFDLLQVPYSILDRRFEKYFPTLKEKNIEVHTRSVFLQGLIFMDLNKLPKYFFPVKKILEKFNKVCKNNNIPKNHLALFFVLKNKYIDKVVIGVDSFQQLKENININLKKLSKLNTNFDEFIYNDENILLPYKWKI